MRSGKHFLNTEDHGNKKESVWLYEDRQKSTEKVNVAN